MKNKTKGWLKFAEMDKITAEKILEEDGLSNIVLFHSQQMVEKSLKALLEENEADVPKTHGLKKLYFLIPENIKKIINIDQESLGLLDEIYIDSKYPSDIGLLPSGIATKEEARQIYEMALDIYKKIIKIL